jgi:hypothetical protein
MATIVDPRMIDGVKTLRLNDARVAYLSAYQSQITFLESISLQATELNVSTNITGNILFTSEINNSNNINSAGGNFNNLIVNTIQNSNLLTTNLTATNNTTLGNLSVTGDVITDFKVITADNDYTFSDADKSKVIHFDTTTTPEISAIFPDSLSDGFNVGLINAGIGVMYLSGENIINAPGISNSQIYTGIFVYKVNGALFGVGSFE